MVQTDKEREVEREREREPLAKASVTAENVSPY